MFIEGYDPDEYEVETCFEGPRNIYGEECPICHYTPEYHFDDICAEHAKAAEVADAAEANGSSDSSTEQFSLSFADVFLAPMWDILDDLCADAAKAAEANHPLKKLNEKITKHKML